MGKEIFALPQRQKSSHSEALKSSPRKETDGSGASFSVTRKSSGGAGGWMRITPGPGIGAVIPSDWCTLMSKRELSVAQSDGYAGSGTEDLYMVWNDGIGTQRQFMKT